MECESVTAVVRRLKHNVEGDYTLRNIAMVGNILGLQRASAGHYYMSLHDEQCSIRAIFFRGRVGAMMDAVKEGDQVVVVGSLNVYEKGGSVSFIIERLFSQGIGTLQQQLEARKKALAAEGLFDEAHKKMLPRFPWRVGVLTSKTGAVLHDIHKIAAERNPYIDICLYPIPVQGEAAIPEIVQALHEAGNNERLDILILARGGGSLEDLWCFNDEQVVRAVFQTKVPIITAIGHETDTTLVDYAADVRAARPTHAAELAFPSITDIEMTIAQMMDVATKRIQVYIDDYMHKVERTLLSVRPEQYKTVLSLRQEQVEAQLRLMTQRLAYIYEQKQGQLETLMARLNGDNPARLAAKGYGQVCCRRQWVKRIAEVSVGDLLDIQLVDGQIQTVVKGVKPYDKGQ